MRLSDQTRRALLGIASFVAVTAAVAVAILAAAIYEVICDEGCTSSPPVRTWQLVIAVAALGCVIGGINLMHRHRVRAGWALFATTLALYALWAVLLF
jgi:hypothetical protein